MPLFGAPQTDMGKESPNTLSKPNPTPPPVIKNPPATIIAAGVRLEGDFKSQGDVQIEGEVIGTVETNAMLSVGSAAKVKAGVKAANASIAGEVTGNINVANALELKSTAKITGEISCSSIVVESGASLNGQVKCGPDTSKTAVKDDPAQTKNEPMAVKASSPEVKN